MRRFDDLAAWQKGFLLMLCLAPIGFGVQWLRSGSIDFKYREPITREDDPGRYWFNVIGAFVFGSLMSVCILFKMLGGPWGN